ncbi:hypothetical protein [Pseudoalteromonas rubra]|uniref:Uncharacterized protein n=1 Tax=Pseudoalteromonas rubra TaxID=43658 RepID=A0A0U3ID58_9GAMM|nr:hypothetical protein [Pseudoalteromonas rubra]ALU46047.1 hypothetical protein AT705_24355 [Pseudoalteromonas rubra]
MTYLIRWIASIALLTLALLTLFKGLWLNSGLLATLGILTFPRRSLTQFDDSAGYGQQLYQKHLVADSNERSTATPYLVVCISVILVVVLYRFLSGSAA